MVKRTTPQLDKLFSRVRRLTKARGSKAALAGALGVPPQRLHEWLSGSVEPGGETTLLLLQWVIAAEATTQKKTAAMLVTPQRRMTRKSKSTSNEKAKSDRPKG
jgi:transcriptional regulator with XRE-family HTH domain